FAKAIKEIMWLADEANKFVDDFKPWLLAKDPEKENLLHSVSSFSIELFKILMTLLKPVVPALAERAEAFLNMELKWDQ
ncbi:hypothetical protein LAN32_26785, partial [Mycobacterium tuberculosis]|nr:hypothetical protein [Mycobacterium tuberculosis]